MDTIEIEDLQFILDLAPLKREELQSILDKAEDALGDAKDALENFDRKIGRIKKILAQHVGEAVSDSPVARTPQGRTRRGESERLTRDFLKQRNGDGATVKEISDATGLKYPTVHRQVKLLREAGYAASDENRKWHWIAAQ